MHAHPVAKDANEAPPLRIVAIRESPTLAARAVTQPGDTVLPSLRRGLPLEPAVSRRRVATTSMHKAGVGRPESHKTRPDLGANSPQRRTSIRATRSDRSRAARSPSGRSPSQVDHTVAHGRPAWRPGARSLDQKRVRKARNADTEGCSRLGFRRGGLSEGSRPRTSASSPSSEPEASGFVKLRAEGAAKIPNGRGVCHRRRLRLAM